MDELLACASAGELEDVFAPPGYGIIGALDVLDKIRAITSAPFEDRG